MKFAIERQTLYEALNSTQSILSSSGMPIVYLKVKESNTLLVTAFDHELTYNGEYDCITYETGEIAVSGKNFFDYVRELPDGKISLETTENQRLHLNVGQNISCKFAGLDTLSCPETPSMEDKTFIPLERKMLLSMIQKTLISVSTDESRPYCMGCFFEVPDDYESVRMVSTDGHRMTIVDSPLPRGLKEVLPKGVIISRKTIMELKKLITASGEDHVLFSLSGSSLFFKVNRSTLIAKLINGKFPNYSVILSRKPQYHLHISKKEFQSSIKRISATADQNKNIRFYFNENTLTLKSSNPDLGEAHEIINIEKDIPEMVLGYNAQYFLDMLYVLSSDGMIIKFTDDKCPVLIEPQDEEQKCRFVIMPVRVVA